MSPPSADVALEPEKDACNPDADSWVASGDILSEQSSEEALDSQPSSGTDVQQGTSESSIVSGTPTKRATAVWLRQKSKSFGDAAKKAVVAEAQSFVKDAQELAVGMVEGAQLTAQDTLFLKEKLFSRKHDAEGSKVEGVPARSTSKAKVAGLRGFLGSVRRGNGATPEVVTDADGEMLGGISPAVLSPTSASLSISPPASGPETNPLRALSRGLAAQLGTTTVRLSPTSSPQKEGRVMDTDDASSSAAPVLPLFPTATGPAAEGKLKLPELSESASPEVVASPSKTPTDALERLLEGDSDYDEDVDSDDDQVATATSTMDTSPTAGEVSTDLMMAKASGAPLAQRLKGLAAVRLKGLRPGWQTKAKAGAVLPANSGTASEELVGAAFDKVVEAEKSFLMLPSTLANYVEIGELIVSHGSGAGVVEAVEMGTSEKPLVCRTNSEKLSDKMASAAQRTSGLLEKVRGFGGNLAAAAARNRSSPGLGGNSPSGRGGSSPSGPGGREGSNFEDSLFAIETDEDIFSEEASDHSPCHSLPFTPSSSIPAVVPEGADEAGDADGQEEIVVVDQDDLAEALFDREPTN